MQKNNYQNWSDSISYTKRWIVESIFSCVKKMFGEYVICIRFQTMIKEVMLKA
ncbi:MAG: hypothetical protein ACPKQO_11210 [Nitrososphaeraceae archaeon]